MKSAFFITCLVALALAIWTPTVPTQAQGSRDSLSGRKVTGVVETVSETSVQLRIGGKVEEFTIEGSTQKGAELAQGDEVIASVEDDGTLIAITPKDPILVFMVKHPLRDANPLGFIMAPGLSWIGSGVIIMCTLVVLTAMTVQIWWIRRPVHWVALELEKKRSPLNGAGLGELDDLFEKGQAKPLTHAWNKFRETVLAVENETGRGSIYNTRPAEEFFTEDTVVNHRINLPFYSSVPGIVTGLGLLLTFLAIFVGLMNVKVAKASSTIEGIEGLINGLAGKFLTSIVALFCATIYLIIEKPLVHKLNNSYYRFVHALNKLFSRRAFEAILHDMLRNLDEQTTAFRQFGVDLSTRLKEGLSEGLGPTLARMVEVVERLATQQRQDNTKAIQDMVAQFLRGLEGTTNSQFNELQQVLASASEQLKAISRAGEESQDRLATFVRDLNNSVAEQNRVVGEQIVLLRNTVGEVLTRLESTATSVTSTIRDAQARSQAHLSDTVETVLQRTATWTDQVDKTLRAALDEHRAASEHLARAKAVLNESLEAFRAMLTEGRLALQSVNQAAHALLESQRTLASTAMEMQKMQDQAGRNAQELARQLANLREVSLVQRETLARFQSVFREMDTSLGKVLTQISNSMERYSQLVKDYTTEQLKQFDEKFAEAASQLENSCQVLEDSCNEVSRGLQKVTNSLEDLAGRLSR